MLHYIQIFPLVYRRLGSSSYCIISLIIGLLPNIIFYTFLSNFVGLCHISCILDNFVHPIFNGNFSFYTRQMAVLFWEYLVYECIKVIYSVLSPWCTVVHHSQLLLFLQLLLTCSELLHLVPEGADLSHIISSLQHVKMRCSLHFRFFYFQFYSFKCWIWFSFWLGMWRHLPWHTIWNCPLTMLIAYIGHMIVMTQWCWCANVIDWT